MKYISEDGTVYKSKKDYLLTTYPMKENEILTNYIRRIKRNLDPNYKEKINKTSREYMKNKYHSDEKFKEYQKNNALKRYHTNRSIIDENNINK